MDNSPLMENLRKLFAECDTDKNGSLGRDEFGQLCSKIGLNTEVAAETFDRLDIDRNEKITFDEFAAGFIQTCKQQQQPASATRDKSPVNGQANHTAKQTNSPGSPSAGSRSLASGQQQQYASQKPVTGANIPSRLAPNPHSAPNRGRKSASPIGVLSLGSTGSSGSCSNLASTSSNQSASNSNYYSAGQSSSSSSLRGMASQNQLISTDSSGGDLGGGASCDRSDVIIYSSDMLPESSYDYNGDQSACGSGQFGSMMSNSSYSQVKTMQDLLDCVQKLQSENQQLSQIFFKDKREREEYISQLGEEFDQQLKEVEERANRRAREELENEKKRLREMMQAERETLEHHYQTLEKIGKLVKAPNGKLDDGSTIDKVRCKLEDTFVENRQLKKSLLDTKTDVALIWKEMEKIKRQYEDKLSSAYEKHNETKSECDHIKQQLNLMKDSNRRLQDASDVITNYITDKVEPVIKVATTNYDDDMMNSGGNSSQFLHPNNFMIGAGTSPNNSRRGSILSEYLVDNDDNTNNDRDGSGGNNKSHNNSTTDDGTNASSNGDLESMASSQGGGGLKFNHTSNSATKSLITNNLRQTSTVATAAASKTGSDLLKLSSPDRMSNIKLDDSESIDSSKLSERSFDEANFGNHNDNINDENTRKQQPQTISSKLSATSSGLKNIGKHFLLGSRSSSSDAKIKEQSTINPESSSPSTKVVGVKSISADHVDEICLEPADGPSKATFNIILVGDSFVGKSSFAARFMEGSFVQGLISNCSIDFKTKAYKIDGNNYTINLWDTAGQERFRSITASYFRKADGIILMYDVTDKRSYLNVRNWMSTISDTASENVAVLLVGNKIDLRNKNNKDKCVPTEEGYRLAREYDIVFLETSVKTGTNLLPSMGRLIRLIAKSNIEEEEDKDRIRLNDKSRAFNCMPKNC